MAQRDEACGAGAQGTSCMRRAGDAWASPSTSILMVTLGNLHALRVAAHPARRRAHHLLARLRRLLVRTLTLARHAPAPPPALALALTGVGSQRVGGLGLRDGARGALAAVGRGPPQP